MHPNPDPQATPDLVLLDGEVLTADAAFRTARAVAITGGTVTAVGTTDAVRALAGPRTEVVDLRGRTALPGINDSHLHGCAFGSTRPPLALDVGFPAVRSIAGIQAAVKDAASRLPEGAWIRGNGWDTGYLTECADGRRMPDRADLDAVAPRHPVYLQDFSGHLTWANTRALDLAGVTADTPVPEGGVVHVDGAGNPTGLLAEGAQDLVQRHLPAYTRDQIERAIREAVATLQREGITSYTEPGLGPGGKSLFAGAAGQLTLDVYADLARAGDLGARVGVLLLLTGMGGSAADIAEGLASARVPKDVDPRILRVLGVKLFADGIPPNKTAWMSEEYTTGGHGCLCVHGAADALRTRELTEMVRLAHAAGHQLGVHVTGDLAIDAVVDAFEAAQAEHPRDDPRHYIIHADLVGRRSLRKLAAHGFGANMNPAIKWTIADMLEEMLGHERAAYQYPVRSAIDAGVPVTASSDAPVTYPNWRQGIAAMLLRESKASGRTFGPQERVGLPDAVRAYTANAAWQDFAEDWKGTLEPGKAADVTVLDGTLTAIDPHDLPDTPVAMTVFDGRVVHAAEGV
ncbi:amidohydrolase [Actinomadura verrucosospora]|uniref:Metal-dependent amidohydrolase n=1 Tax=Actinomadura verrucosospora TaxID=46165 RepID=A0A7D3VS34_ACTVE|nr:amidohydrolase [Actinomadura verrucosospora]QKG21440.1 metal-dependent amidohydrolase [Actinomadura verrucosospora]